MITKEQYFGKYFIYIFYFFTQTIIMINQILYIKNGPQKSSNKKIFKIQLLFSVLVIVILLISIVFSFYRIRENEKNSKELIKNYNIYKLYNNSQEKNINSKFFGTIEIPKIHITYPIFTELSDDNLKIAPCKFYGPPLGVSGNICIAGHNYDNEKFFSNLKHLNINDIIYIYDNTNYAHVYKIYKIYEVKANDLSPVENYNKNNFELTLVTCNNFNGNRVIVKALGTNRKAIKLA